jgi:TolB-like protein
LSKIAGLLVISRNSSFTYKGRSVDVRVVGRDLGELQAADARQVRQPDGSLGLSF